MKIEILSLFPDMFTGFLNDSIIKRAQLNNRVTIRVVNFRDYSKLSNNQVDDTPYGGGAGMVIRPEAVFDCLDDLNPLHDAYIVITSPAGKTFNENIAKSYAQIKHLIIICGHYEGFDERIMTLCDAEISMGDFILTGGEIPAMAIVDAVTRLIPGVINSDSLTSESFEDNLLDYPTYTKPAIYRGLKVPDVLLSGNHQKIKAWREEQRKLKTLKTRPDLINK
jgi:tRNA (guanine37-N1)-methyltransferase